LRPGLVRDIQLGENCVDTYYNALTGYLPHLVPEALLLAAACILFLAGTFHARRDTYGLLALVVLVGAGLALWFTPAPVYVNADNKTSQNAAWTALYSAPLVFDNLSFYIRFLAIAGGAVIVLLSWHEVDDEHAAEYHACLLIITAGVCFTGAANELITLFLALELISIPTYVLLYLPRSDEPAQEAAMKYFLLSIFSSAFLLFGFSYLYGIGGTTNLAQLTDALRNARGNGPLATPGLSMVALIMIVAGLGFKITAVPFHFYAPDVYQGTTAANAGLLAFVPKVAGFVALIRILGFVTNEVATEHVGDQFVSTIRCVVGTGETLYDKASVVLWILAAVTMTLGNILALLQDNVKRLLAYSSVAHAGYMLVGLATAAALAKGGSVVTGGVEGVLFYLVAYGAMTLGAFAVLSYLGTRDKPINQIEDLAGLWRSQPVVALMMAVFLFSLVGMPATAGFMGKVFIFWGPMGLVPRPGDDEAMSQYVLNVALAVIGMLNAAIGGWYYLRVVAVMFLRESAEPRGQTRAWPAFGAVVVCVLATVVFGVYTSPLLNAVQKTDRPAVSPVVSGGEGRAEAGR
jgi:NADH-quinone oxidoreductase subunit N